MSTYARLFTAILMSIFLTGCLENQCEETVLHEWISPDKKNVAVLLLLNCGATTPYANIVMLRGASELTKDVPPEKYILSMRQNEHVKVEWRGNKNILIKRPNDRSMIFKELDSMNGIQVDYSSY